MSGSTVLDLTLVLLLALYAWSGWRQGFVSALLGLIGLVGGAFLAMRVVPGLVEAHTGILDTDSAETTQPASDDATAEPKKKPARRGKRASVPSWDEIMFGKKAD